MELGRVILIFNSVEGKTFLEKFEEATGIDLKCFWEIGYIVYLKYLSSEDFLPNGLVLEKKDFLLYLKNIPMDKVDRTLQLLSANLDTITSLHKEKINAFGNENYNFEFLREKPLLEFETGRYICLSMPYLIRKITSGILEIIKELLGTEKFNDELRDVFSKCYETYVANLTRDTYDSPYADRFFKRKYNKIEISDGVIDYGDRLVFLEVKAVSIQKRYRLSEEYTMLEEALRPFLTRKGAVQLDKRIMEFKAGKIKINEIDRNKIMYYYPVLITCLDPLPIYPRIAEEYIRIMEKNNILQQYGVCKLTIVTLHEYEYIMKLVEQGESFIEIIKRKNSSEDSRQMSMLNFLILNYKDKGRPHHLQVAFENFNNDILASINLAKQLLESEINKKLL
jgi:hypothetical protein